MYEQAFNKFDSIRLCARGDRYKKIDNRLETQALLS